MRRHSLDRLHASVNKQPPLCSDRESSLISGNIFLLTVPYFCSFASPCVAFFSSSFVYSHPHPAYLDYGSVHFGPLLPSAAPHGGGTLQAPHYPPSRLSQDVECTKEKNKGKEYYARIHWEQPRWSTREVAVV